MQWWTRLLVVFIPPSDPPVGATLAVARLIAMDLPCSLPAQAGGDSRIVLIVPSKYLLPYAGSGYFL